MISAVPSTPAAASRPAAVMVAVPSATPVTRPRLRTEATAVSLELQPKAAASTACPLSSVAVATSRTVSPAARARVAGATSTVAAVCETATEAVSDTSPESAAMVALPLATAVTTPLVSTVATVTVVGAGAATSTAKLCVAESPPGSETVTVTAAAPRAPPVIDSSVPERPTVATAGLDVVATWVSASPSGSENDAERSILTVWPSTTAWSGIASPATGARLAGGGGGGGGGGAGPGSTCRPRHRPRQEPQLRSE